MSKKTHIHIFIQQVPSIRNTFYFFKCTFAGSSILIKFTKIHTYLLLIVIIINFQFAFCYVNADHPISNDAFSGELLNT